jgi:Zn-dependent alcohol dehydrogenase
MKIRAVVLDAVGGPVRVDTLDLAEPRAGEVLVRMRAAGVCHSDQHVITGRHSADLPCVLGHEGAGEVAAVGPGVETVRAGDRVALNWLPSCNSCFYCSHGQEHLCREVVSRLWPGFMMDGTSRLSRNGETIRHYSGVSTWAEHMVVAQECCVPLHDDVPFEVAALIGCAVATGVGAARHRGNVGRGDRVAVVGAGGVGLSVIMGAALVGAERIIAVDREATKRDLATSLGATDFVEAGSGAEGGSIGHAVDEVIGLTGGRGADVVFEAIGNPRLQQEWIRGVRPGGTLVLVGIPGHDETTLFNSAELSRLSKTVKGSYYASTDAGRAIDDLCGAYLTGRLPVDRLISQRYRIGDVQHAIDAMLSGSEGRTVITFD